MNPSQRPIFISFYCGDPYYARGAAALRQRCDVLGVPILIEAIEDAGGYWRNTLRKPIFIRDKLEALRRDLIWIDVDTILHRDHAAFQSLTADLTMASHSGDLTGVKASPIAVAYNPRAVGFITAWAECCRSRLESNDVDLDHDILKYDILPAFVGRVSIRLMGDPTDPRDFTEGRTITNGLSRRAGGPLRVVLAKNRVRSARFARLHLDHFTAPRLVD